MAADDKVEQPLSGRVVAVTGAAAGLGRAYVDHLSALGAHVVANDVVDAEHRAGVVSHVADISTDDGATSLIETAVAEFGRLDALVNNAGILRSGLMIRLPVEHWDAVQQVHLRGTFLTSRAAGRYWRDRAKAGEPVDAALVNTTSAAGLYGFVGEAAYSAAKAGIAAFTLVTATELERYGVTVNALAPAARTRMTESWAGQSPDDPQHDPLAVEHVAPVVAWLVGNDARDVSAHVFEVGNGSLSVVAGWRPAATVDLPLTGYAAGPLIRPLLDQVSPPVAPFHPERL